MKKFNTKFYIDGEYYGFAITSIQGAKDYIATRPYITSCEGFADDEWFTYSVEKGWEHFYDTDNNDGEIADECWDYEDKLDEVGYNPYTGCFDMDC